MYPKSIIKLKTTKDKRKQKIRIMTYFTMRYNNKPKPKKTHKNIKFDNTA